MKQMSNSELLAQARSSLRGNWGTAISICLVYMLILGLVSSVPFVGAVIALVIGGPLALGAARAFLALQRGETFSFDTLFSGFSDFGRTLGAYLLVSIYTTLWTLLFIVPGIVKALAYALTFYILVDDPTIGADNAINKSIKMMYGYKTKLFGLCIRFFFLSLLCILTLGIGFIWFVPYVEATMAAFYLDVKQEQTAGTVDGTEEGAE